MLPCSEEFPLRLRPESGMIFLNIMQETVVWTIRMYCQI